MTAKRKNLKAIPRFKNEAEERAFWEAKSRDSTDYIDWSKARRMEFPNPLETRRRVAKSR